MAGTKIVKRYKINALVIIEKSPRVSIVTGKLIMFSIGFNIKNMRARTTAPTSKVINPPSIVNPGTSCGMKYKASRKIPIERKIVLIDSIRILPQ